jgi:hypothetical protein
MPKMPCIGAFDGMIKIMPLIGAIAGISFV